MPWICFSNLCLIWTNYNWVFKDSFNVFSFSPRSAGHHFRILRDVYSLTIYTENVGSSFFRNVCIYMLTYMASHRTKPYFYIHSIDIIISHNGNHSPVLPLLFLCLWRPWLGLPCRFLYSWSLYVVPCLGFPCLHLDHAGCQASVRACCVSCHLPTWRSLVLYFHVAALWMQHLFFFPIGGRCYPCSPVGLDAISNGHWPFPWPGPSIYIIICALWLTCSVDDACSAKPFWGSPLVGVMCSAVFAYADVKSLDVIFSLLCFLGQTW